MKKIINNIKSVLIRMTFPYWKSQKSNQKEGYDLLVPVPGDLPVFTQVALDIIGRQDSSHLNEILVIPDLPSAKFRSVFQKASSHNPHSHLIRLIEMKPHQQFIGRLSRSGNMFHFLQLVSGIENSNSSYVLFHDADLFLPPGDFFYQRYEKCTSMELSVLGINPREKRYTDNCHHLVATWEMVAQRDWLYQFHPYQVRGMQNIKINGKQHTFDTTHWMQYLSSPQKINYLSISQNFIHFNYVITTYRRFLKSSRPYEDRWFKLLLIRLLVDSCESIGWYYDKLPTIHDFEKALSSRNSQIIYNASESIENYTEFREKLELLLQLGCFDRHTINRMNEKIRPFDNHFGWIPFSGS